MSATTWYAIKTGDHSCLMLSVFDSPKGRTFVTQDAVAAHRALGIWGGHLVAYPHAGTREPSYAEVAAFANTTWRSSTTGERL